VPLRWKEGGGTVIKTNAFEGREGGYEKVSPLRGLPFTEKIKKRSTISVQRAQENLCFDCWKRMGLFIFLL